MNHSSIISQNGDLLLNNVAAVYSTNESTAQIISWSTLFKISAQISKFQIKSFPKRA